MRRLTWVAVVIVSLILGFVIGAIVGLNSLQGVAFVLAGLAFGMILGFFLDWLLEEAYRRNRELTEQLQIARRAPKQLPPPQPEIAEIDDADEIDDIMEAERIAILEPAPTDNVQGLVDMLQQKEEELKTLRAELEAVDTKGRAINERFITYMKSHPDDLTVIKGVGAVYQWKLRDVGVHSYHDLAEADAEHLRRVLDIKNWQRTDIESWIKQARDWATKN